MDWTQYWRVAQFLAHAVTSIALLAAAFSTSCSVVQVQYLQSYSAKPLTYPILLTNPTPPCPPPSTNTSMGFPTVSWADAACAATIWPPTFDTQEDVRSFTMGASWNVLMVLVVMEWCSASYALIVLDQPESFFHLVPTPPGTQPQPFLATVWNLALLVILWVLRGTLSVPDNNLLMFTFLLIAATVKQNFLALHHMEPEPSPHSSHMEAEAPPTWKTDHFLHKRKRSKDFIDAGAVIPLHNRRYLEALETTGDSAVSRLMDLTNTAPLVVVACVLQFDNSGLVWVGQSILVSFVAWASSLVGMHCAAMIACKCPDVRPTVQTAGILVLVGGWFCLGSGMAIVLWTSSGMILESPTTSGLGGGVLGSVWVMAAGYVGFQGMVTWFYGGLLWYKHYTQISTDNNVGQIVMWADVITLVIKMTVSWTFFLQGLQCPSPSC